MQHQYVKEKQLLPDAKSRTNIFHHQLVVFTVRPCLLPCVRPEFLLPAPTSDEKTPGRQRQKTAKFRLTEKSKTILLCTEYHCHGGYVFHSTGASSRAQ